MGKNYKKYLRRMAVASVCVAVLCLTCLTSATLALFAVEVSNEGNVIEVAQFTAASETIVKQAALDVENPMVISNGSSCPEGSYELNIAWRGNTAGYIKININAAAEDSKTEGLAFAVNLPASNEEEEHNLRIPLTLHEAAVITTESTWGVYEAAEEENVTVLGMDNVISFIDAGGITFGVPFEFSVAIGTDVIGEDVETAMAYVPGTYYLTIDWTPRYAGYCVLDFVSAEEGSDTEAAKYIIKLPQVEETEGGENIVISIPLYLHEATYVTAVAQKGTADNAVEWQTNVGITFGTQFTADAAIGPVIPDTEFEYSDLPEAACEAGLYRLKLDWTEATADGYCVVTVGDEVYYLSCSMGDEPRERVITLDLKRDAVITVTTEKGTVPEGVVPMIGDILICGAQFAADAAMGAVPSEGDVSYAAIGTDAYAAGTYQLKLDWAGATVDGYCVITVTGENGSAEYYLSCPVGGEPVVIPLELKDAAVVTVTSGMGAYSGEAQQLTDEGIVYEVQQTVEAGTNNE